MQITWKAVTGTQEQAPLEVDVTSSADTVYLRKNIKPTTIELGTEEVPGYSYEEAQLTLAEYEQYQKEQAELNSEAFKVQKDNDAAIMMALAEIYEMIAQ